MVLRADVLAAAIDAAAIAPGRPRLVMSPRGRPLTQARVADLAAGPGPLIVCGRFEGIDQRVIDARGLEEVSIGDYVLSGGEIAAMVLLDACVRLVPGVMGKLESGTEESFSAGLLEYPQYNPPPELRGPADPRRPHVRGPRQGRRVAAGAGGILTRTRRRTCGRPAPPVPPAKSLRKTPQTGDKAFTLPYRSAKSARFKAFSSEVASGSREENASKQKHKAFHRSHGTVKDLGITSFAQPPARAGAPPMEICYESHPAA